MKNAILFLLIYFGLDNFSCQKTEKKKPKSSARMLLKYQETTVKNINVMK